MSIIVKYGRFIGIIHVLCKILLSLYYIMMAMRADSLNKSIESFICFIICMFNLHIIGSVSLYLYYLMPIWEPMLYVGIFMNILNILTWLYCWISIKDNIIGGHTILLYVICLMVIIIPIIYPNSFILVNIIVFISFMVNILTTIFWKNVFIQYNKLQ